MANTNSTNSWLDPPELHGNRNTDGTYTLSELELKALNAFNYRISKMIQGELNLKNLNADTNAVFNGKVSFVDLSDPTSETVINGGLITTGSIDADLITTGTLSANRVSGGTLEGVTLKSTGSSQEVTINSGIITISSYGGQYGGAIEYDADGRMLIYTVSNVPIKIESSSNMSIDSNGAIYIGASAGKSGMVSIGQEGGVIMLNGTVLVNGTPLGG